MSMQYQNQLLYQENEELKKEVERLKKKSDMQPRAYRPLYIEYSTVGYILRYERSIYDMTEQEFQTACMVHSNGYMNPKRALEIFKELKEEAGLIGEE